MQGAMAFQKGLGCVHSLSHSLGGVDPRLPHGKLPDRSDFLRYATDRQGRMRDWTAATSASRQLADEFAQWLERPDPARVEPL